MRHTKTNNSGSRGNSLFRIVKPAILGFAAAVVISILFIVLFALIFVIMKSIVSSAIVPLSLLAAAIGCFAGAYLCACISRKRGFFYGLAIGLTLFAVIYVLGLALGSEYFGTLAAVKLICLSAAGGLGGWCGSSRAHTRRRRA